MHSAMRVRVWAFSCHADARTGSSASALAEILISAVEARTRVHRARRRLDLPDAAGRPHPGPDRAGPERRRDPVPFGRRPSTQPASGRTGLADPDRAGDPRQPRLHRARGVEAHLCRARARRRGQPRPRLRPARTPQRPRPVGHLHPHRARGTGERGAVRRRPEQPQPTPGPGARRPGYTGNLLCGECARRMEGSSTERRRRVPLPTRTVERASSSAAGHPRRYVRGSHLFARMPLLHPTGSYSTEDADHDENGCSALYLPRAPSAQDHDSVAGRR